MLTVCSETMGDPTDAASVRETVIKMLEERRKPQQGSVADIFSHRMHCE